MTGRTLDVRIPTRWTDFDTLGHLNQAMYHVYLGLARDDALKRTVGGIGVWPCVLAHAEIDYHREIRLGAVDIAVRTTIAGVGRTSVNMEHVVLTPAGETAARAKSVVVAWDTKARGAREISSADRRALIGDD